MPWGIRRGMLVGRARAGAAARGGDVPDIGSPDGRATVSSSEHDTADVPPPASTPVVYRAPVRRLQPPQVADERESLEGWLDYYRAQVVLALDGLPVEALRRRVPETGPSLVGIVKHLTDVERTWLVERWGYRGGRAAHALSHIDDSDEAFRVSDLDDPAALVGAYQEACERGRDALAGAESLDDAVRDDRRGHIELRWILLNLITETARRSGQAQALREVLLAAEEPMDGDGQLGETDTVNSSEKQTRPAMPRDSSRGAR